MDLLEQLGLKLNKQAEGMMQTLNISPERCEELCQAIEMTKSEHLDWSFGQVLEEACNAHCRNFNEVMFMCYTFGTHSGFFQGVEAGRATFQRPNMFDGIELASPFAWRGKRRSETQHY